MPVPARAWHQLTCTSCITELSAHSHARDMTHGFEEGGFASPPGREQLLLCICSLRAAPRFGFVVLWGVAGPLCIIAVCKCGVCLLPAKVYVYIFTAASQPCCTPLHVLDRVCDYDALSRGMVNSSSAVEQCNARERETLMDHACSLTVGAYLIPSMIMCCCQDSDCFMNAWMKWVSWRQGKVEDGGRS